MRTLLWLSFLNHVWSRNNPRYFVLMCLDCVPFCISIQAILCKISQSLKVVHRWDIIKHNTFNALSLIVYNYMCMYYMCANVSELVKSSDHLRWLRAFLSHRKTVKKCELIWGRNLTLNWGKWAKLKLRGSQCQQ